MDRPRYPLLTPPLPPGLVTLDDYGGSIDRTARYLQTYWSPQPGFPKPKGELPGRGRHGGGRRVKVYSAGELDEFRARHDTLWGHRSIRLIIGHHPGELVTLEQFARISGIGADPGRFPGCPPPGDDGRRRLGDLIAWHNDLPAAAGPPLAVTPLGKDELITVTGFARLVGVHRTNVEQYSRLDPGFPVPAMGTRYRLGVLARWWNSRPGKRPSRRTQDRR